VSSVHFSDLVAESFKYSHLVFAAATFNGGVFTGMASLLTAIRDQNLQNRTIAFIENGSWAANAKVTMEKILRGLKNVTFLEKSVNIRSCVSEKTLKELEELAKIIALDTLESQF
jgi:flavorubredoxin